MIKSKFPYADALVSTAGNNDGFISSKEHAESPDANNKFMGTGPYMFVDATPPVKIFAGAATPTTTRNLIHTSMRCRQSVMPTR